MNTATHSARPEMTTFVARLDAAQDARKAYNAALGEYQRALRARRPSVEIAAKKAGRDAAWLVLQDASDAADLP